MLDAVIVDDEYYFRESLKGIIPWEELGVTIAGEANNGEDGLELIRSSNPDIAIVDINMPVIDGLELIERTRGSGLRTEIVVVSGHSEFEFAQKAIRFGVTNYLLKPIVGHELRSCVEALSERIRLQREDSMRVDQIIRSKKIRSILNGTSLEYLPEQLESCESFQVVAMDVSGRSLKTRLPDQRESLPSELVSRLQEISNGVFCAQAAFDSNDHLVLILGNLPGNAPAKNRFVKHCVSLLGSHIEEQHGFRVWSGIGRVYGDHRKISESYREALVTLKMIRIHESSEVAEYEAVRNPLPNHGLFGQESRRALFREIRANDRPAIERRLRDLFGSLQEMRAAEEVLNAYAFDLILAAIEFCGHERVLEHRISELNNMFSEVQKTVAIRAVEEILLEAVLSLAGEFAAHSNDRNNIISDTKAYVLENVFDPEFGIQNIADRFRMNYSYLCSLFKSRTGETLNSFITDIRLTRAQELLRETDNSISSIAYLCGYNDQYYFSRVFKKHFGFPPSKMR